MAEEVKEVEETVEEPVVTEELSEEEELEVQLKSVLDELEALRKENASLKEKAEGSEKKAASQKERLRKLVMGITDSSTHSDINTESDHSSELPVNGPVKIPEDYFTAELDW